MMKRSMLLLLTFLGSAAWGQAQPMPSYGNGGYPPAPANPYGNYGNPQYYSQPMQPAQYGYGNSPSNGYPPASYGQQPYYAPPNNYGYQNGYGVNYFYMQNPVGPSPTPGPYGAVANRRALEATPAGYPAPPAGAPGIYQGAPMMADDGGTPGADVAKPPVLFHREPRDCFWFSADYMGSIIAPMRVPTPLLTTGSPTAAFPPGPGGLGEPSTSVLYGNSNVNLGLFSGIALEAGVFLDNQDTFSLDWRGFLLPANSQNAHFQGDATGNPVLNRPVVNLANGQEGGFVNTLPGAVTGTIDISTRTEMAGMEFNSRVHGYFFEGLHIDGLLGFRYARLDESLHIQENLQNIAPGFLTFQGAPIATGNSMTDHDFFDTNNQFFGPQIGGHLRYEQKWFDLDAFAKVALGANFQQVNISGGTSVLSPTGVPVANAAGGVLALPSNIGSYSRAVFGVLPEFGLGLSVHVTQHIDLHMGYSLMMWSHVVRPGDQINRDINPGLVPSNPTFGTITGPTGPTYHFNDEFLWVQSVNLGLEFHF